MKKLIKFLALVVLIVIVVVVIGYFTNPVISNWCNNLFETIKNFFVNLIQK